MSEENQELKKCRFCQLTEDKVMMLVEAPPEEDGSTIHICDQCIEMARDFVGAHRTSVRGKQLEAAMAAAAEQGDGQKAEA